MGDGDYEGHGGASTRTRLSVRVAEVENCTRATTRYVIVEHCDSQTLGCTFEET
jgi:hypothetical protein